MGTFLVKASPVDDLYLIWSTVVDAPILVFASRVEAREYLWGEFYREHPGCVPGPIASPDARLDRADRTGTSATNGNWYGWNQDRFSVSEAAPPLLSAGGWWCLPRSNLPDYCRALLNHRPDTADALLEWRNG